MKRRTLLGAAVGLPLLALALARPSKKSGAHDEYFKSVQGALLRAGLLRPTLVIDRQKFAHNIGRLKTNLAPGMAYRIVVKSLPALGMVRQVAADMQTDRLMVFHQPFLNYLATQMPEAQMLVGKPMPAGAAQRFFDKLDAGDFDPAAQVEWLVDTPQRIAEYGQLARVRLGGAQGTQRMKLNLEVDVGLHRGGFRTAQEVAEAIRAIEADPALAFSGLMGYEAHAAKIPDALGGLDGALAKSKAFYAECVDAAREVQQSRFVPEALTLNMGGSNTYRYYSDADPCNELAIGSGLVKPTDFDTVGLSDHVPACFIATPVLKALDTTEIPGIESLAGLFRAWDPNTQRTFYTYGGYWLANAVSPPGLQRNDIWGHSTNQDMLNGSDAVELEVGDYVFLRPHQSEFVFLQFGDIAVYDNGQITEMWPVFQQVG